MAPHLTWVEVDLDAIRNNVRLLKGITRTRLMAVVKADAYGHGAVEVARAAAEAGADWLGVARPDEGLELRSRGLALPILVLGRTPPDQAGPAISADLTLALFDFEAAQAYDAAAHTLGRHARVHVKVDTGMGRLGLRPEAVLEFMRGLKALAHLEVEGVFTHFSSADEADLTSAHRQLMEFEDVVQSLSALELRPPLVHAANSAAAFALPGARLDLVRAGIAVYGLNPSGDAPCPPGFIPALTWKAAVVQVKTLPPGHAVSYGREYVTKEMEAVAIVPVGYADGFRRVPKNVNEVLIHGQFAKALGRVCMDQVVVGVNHIPGVRVGDEVVLIGRQGDAAMSAEDVARRWGTINYDVTCGIMARVPRVYK